MQTLGMATAVERGRSAFDRQAWRAAHTALTEAAAVAPLGPDDQERLAVSAYLIGADEECAEAWAGAQRAALEAGDPATAARCMFWLGFVLMMRGQVAQAHGWLARADGLLREGGLECAAAGYLLVPAFLGALDGGDLPTALELAARAGELGKRFDDPDLRAFATLAHGQALLATGEIAAGTARLDEAMVAVTAGEVGPITSGIVYCAVVLECMRLFDMPRASEWTAALSAWCDAQPDLVPYRGQCLVHRSQLQQAAGAWQDACATAEAACKRLSDPPHPALGLARYQEAELCRLRGDLEAAASGYGQARRHGVDPMPGLALLELARGEGRAAAASIRRALQETPTTLDRPALLAAAVDILSAAGDVRGARDAAGELSAIAAGTPSEALQAMAAQATGTVLLHEGDAGAALRELRAAAAAWQSLRMPYQAAAVAVLLGRACVALGDRTSAGLEFASAKEGFAALGAIPDVARAAALAGEPPHGTGPTGGLSARECEVLAHVAAGITNRAIAATLHISEHTVGRHLENIFAKLGVTSRAAATAYAYEHHLL